MSKLPFFALLALSLLGGGFRDLYCPECERFSSDEWAIDARGICRGCERRPVGVEASARPWVWCETYEEWRDEACSHDPTLRCCATWTAAVLKALPMEARVARHPFCPQCRSFRGFEPGRDGRDRCAGCGKPAAMTPAAELTWFWCRTEARWSTELLHLACCAAREVKVPVDLALPAVYPSAGGDVFVTTDWLAAHIDDLNLVLVHAEFGPEAADATTRATFQEGHIPFAHPLDWRVLATTRDGLPNEFPPANEMTDAFRRMGIEQDSRVVVYDTGAGLEAARTFVALEYLGMAGRVAILDGHWKKWLREGRELSKSYSGVEPSAFVPRIRVDVLADRRTVVDLAWTALEPSPSAVLIDARPADEYIGTKPGKGIFRPGHLPGAMSVPWMSTIVSQDNPVCRPEGELRALFESKGARPGRRIVAYCRTGVQASHSYAVARSLGYEASLYDGSYAEWSGKLDLPVDRNWAMK